MKRVAVSQRVDSIPERQEQRDALDQRLGEFLVAAGCLPIPVPNRLGTDALQAWLQSVRPDGVVLSGGGDIGSTPERDSTESRLLDYAERERLPALGICRGMQMMGVRFGAVLGPCTGHVGTRHDVGGLINAEVNSFHQFALLDCPAGFDVDARGSDGTIEAIHHRQLPWEAWMWHPEREAPYADRDLDRARRIFHTGTGAPA